MARHKRMETVEEDAPTLDISSLIDVCFLLLIYFLVATTLVKEYKLDMAMPGSASSGETPPLEPANIKVEPSGIVYWGSGANQLPIETNPEEHELNMLFEKLNTFRETAEGIGQKPIVLLEIRNDVKNQRVVDVMNALSRAKIQQVGLADVKED